ncbi:MAG TPA: GNAT family N-acetyltransferase [Rhodospirillaceae bacterium]|nr:GNAT family N-acetyltransferase [Rhodospirillaceae bacterium]
MFDSRQTLSSEDLPLATTGNVEVRLAADSAEVEASQALRYRVFYEEMGARPSQQTAATGLDRDLYDPVCRHLLALADGQVVGSYRLIDRAAAAKVGGFYSANEFDISALQSFPGEILELGRSCVDPLWRNRGTLQQLWQGLSGFIMAHRIGLLFGCASLPGTNPNLLRPQLSYLRDHHLAPEDLRATPLQPLAEVSAAYDARTVLQTLPPLLKGYLRAGASVGQGAVIDEAFNTTDVLVVLRTDALTARYQRRYDGQIRKAA